MNARPAFYARTGSTGAELVTLLHLPYTIWHLAYVVVGAALAPDPDLVVVGGTVVAFFAGLGVGAHAFDELQDRPLATSLSERTLWLTGTAAMVVSAGVAVAGAFVISPWVLAWAVAGVVLACAYSLEWSELVRSDLGFALSWGAFPVLVGYWAQAETVSVAAVGAGAGAAVLAWIQRRLSRAAKDLRRRPHSRLTEAERDDLLAALEAPLRILSLAVPVAAALLWVSRM